MDLTLTEQQNMLQAVVRDLRERDLPKETLVAIDGGRDSINAHWQALVSTGILGSLIPEKYGGAGGSLMDTAVIYEELGRGPVPGPHLASGVLSALVVLDAGTEEQKRSLLPAIASGERTFALAVTEEDYGWGKDYVTMHARAQSDGYVLDGTKVFVHDADLATDFIVAVRIDGRVALASVDAKANGVSARPLVGFETGLSEVRFSGVSVPRSALVGDGNAGWEALEQAMVKGGLIVAAYQVGSLAQVFDMSLLYSQTRRQFQQPIGRFQRVQDHVIDIVNYLDAARWTVNEAIWKMDERRDEAAAAAHTAIVVAKESHYYGCNSAHDVHAGMGIVREYGLTLHTQLSRTLHHYLGSPRYHRRKLAQAIAL